MPNILRYVLWTVLSIGMIFIAISALWFFVIIVGIVIIARLIYLKLFNKQGTFKIHTFTIKNGPPNNYSQTGPKANDQEYTTVIDADDMEKEYKIPKIK